jgi:hypothetical protein
MTLELELPLKERVAGMEKPGLMVLVKSERPDQVRFEDGRMSRGDLSVVLWWGIGGEESERSSGRLGGVFEEEVIVDGSEKVKLLMSSAELFITWKILLP